jgi:hypothetical protein
MVEMGDDTLSSVPDWVPTHECPGKTEQQERERLAIGWELLKMIDEGLLEWSIDPLTEDAVFWPTPQGVLELGMSN